MKNSYPKFNQTIKGKILLSAALLFFQHYTKAQYNGGDSKLDESQKQEIIQKLNNLPSLFKKNMGQWDKEILYQGESSNTLVRYMKNGLSCVVSRPIKSDTYSANLKNKTDETSYEYLVWNLNFERSNENIFVSADGEEDSKINYLIGNDPTQYKTHIAQYSLLTYHNVYDNVDFQFHGINKQTNQLEYDAIVKPGGDAKNIKLSYSGIEELKINKSGDLVIKTKWGTLIDKAPYTYQEIDGIKKKVKAKYKLFESNSFGFEVIGKYDKTKSLIIDPFTMVWSTYMKISANNSTNNNYDIATDTQGNIYITGKCTNNYTITPGAFQTTFGGAGGVSTDAFITKLNASGTALVYSTYIGGSANSAESGKAIAVNSLGEAFITGSTGSTNFPVTNAFQQTKNGTSGNDGFITRLNSTGDALIYSSYIGGSGTDGSLALALDLAGNAYIAGYTNSTDFITLGAYQTAFGGGSTDVFVAKINTSGALVYSTYLGGDNGFTGASPDDLANGIAVDAAGEVIVVGTTYADFFPTGTDPHFPVTPGSLKPIFEISLLHQFSAFVTKFNSSGNGLIYSTYLDGTLGSYGNDIVVNAIGEAYVTGVAWCDDFPTTPGAFRSHGTNAVGDVFISKLTTDGSALIYSTLYGSDSPGQDIGTGIAINCFGEAFVTGYTDAANFPYTSGAYQTVFGGGANDIFLIHISADGTSLGSGGATFIGGSSDDDANVANTIINGPVPRITLSSGIGADTIFVAGTTKSVNFPTTAGAYQQTKLNNAASNQPYVLKMTAVYTNTVLSTTTGAPPCLGNTTTISVTGGSNYTWTPATGLSSTTGQVVTFTSSASGTTTVSVIGTDANGCLDITTAKINVYALPTLLTSNLSFCAKSIGYVEVSNPDPDATYEWSPASYLVATTGGTIYATFPSAGLYTYTIIGTDHNSCKDTVIETIAVEGLPTVVVSQPLSICLGETANLSSQGTFDVYEWYPSTGLSSTNAPNTSSTLDVAGTQVYYLAVVEGVLQCRDTGYTSVHVYTLPTAEIPGDFYFACLGDVGTITATGGTSYAWSTNNNLNSSTGNTITYNANIIGTFNYSVTITDDNNCKDQTVGYVTVVPDVTANAGADISICKGTPTNLNATGGNSYTWNPPSGLSDPASSTTTANPSQTTDYTVTVMIGSCSSSDNVMVTIYNLPIINASSDTSIFNGESVILNATGGTSYGWSPTVFCKNANCDSILASPLETTTYSVTGTDSNGCVSMDWVIVTVSSPICKNIFLPNAFSPNDDEQNDELKVFTNTGCIPSNFHLQIFDRWGNSVFETADITKTWNGKCNNKKLDSEVFVYYMNYKINGETKNAKGNVSLIR